MCSGCAANAPHANPRTSARTAWRSRPRLPIAGDDREARDLVSEPVTSLTTAFARLGHQQSRRCDRGSLRGPRPQLERAWHCSYDCHPPRRQHAARSSMPPIRTVRGQLLARKECTGWFAFPNPNASATSDSISARTMPRISGSRTPPSAFDSREELRELLALVGHDPSLRLPSSRLACLTQFERFVKHGARASRFPVTG